MAVLFSHITLSAKNGSTKTFLCSGIPKNKTGLENWTAYRKFIEDNPEIESVDVKVRSYLYGEGEIVDANEFEVAYFTKRGSDFVTRSTVIKTRKIDADIVQHFVNKKKIVETEEHHNVAFCGYDETGEMKQMHLRSTIPGNRFFMDIEGSDKQYYFRHIGTSENVYVFEAPIDMLSYITLNKENWVEDNYVCLGGVAIDALKNILDRNKNISKVYMCVDKDTAGDKTVKRIGAELDEKGYAWERLLPENKDWNEDLTELKEQTENFELKTGMEMIN